MPTHSRSRDRYRGRDSDREREYSSRRRHREEYDDNDDDGEEEEFIPDRRHRRKEKYRSRGQTQAYGSRNYYESPVEESRPRDPETPHEGRRTERLKAKESPLTSPTKKKDRHLDKHGHRRHKSYGHYGGPSREVRDRSQRARAERRERRRDSERPPDGNAAGKHRRRESDRGAKSRKHKSSESTNSGSHLLSADALAKLGMQHEEEDRLERSREGDRTRKDTKRQKKRPLLGDYEGKRDMLPEEPRRVSKGRVTSGAYLEEGRSPGMQFRRRGGGPPSLSAGWRKEGWNGSVDGTDRQPLWKRKKWWIALTLVIVSLAIIIPVAVVASKKHKVTRSSGSNYHDSGPSNSNLDRISHSDIPVSLLLSVPWLC